MKKYENLVKQTLTALSLFCASVAGAPQSYSPAELTAAAEHWLTGQLSQDGTIQTDITPLDERIGDKYCSQDLAFNLSQPATQRQNTIRIRCNAEQSWQLYVPVRIDEIIHAVVLTQNIANGSRLSADMLETAARPRRFVRGSPVANSAQVIGARAKKALAMGQILTLQDLCLVCKGDVVTISVSDSGLSVVTSGVAQSDGSLGDTISILNQQSRRTVSAQVVGVDLVSVKF